MGKSYFHESYYDHSCTIVPKQDVLQTDIIGRSGLTNLRRWWNGLFLLSYNDIRSREYYTSSHSIRVDRKKQFRHYRNRIHPLSAFRNLWDCLLIWVVTVNQVLFHHNTSLIIGEFSPLFYYIAAILEFFLILDLFVNFKTGYIDKKAKQIILDANKGRMHYCSTKLFLHCASAMPLQLIMFLRYGYKISCGRCKSNKFICVLKVLSLFKLKRIYEASQYWNRDRGSFNATHFWCLFRVGVLGFTTMLCFVDMTDMLALWEIITTGHINESSFYSILVEFKFGRKDPPSNYLFFCHDFSRICKSLLLYSNGLKKKAGEDKMKYLVAYVISNIFYVWALLECYTVISRMKFSEDRVLLNKATTMNMIKSRQLADKLISKVMQTHEFKEIKMKLIENQNGLYTSLPNILKKETLLSCYGRRVARVPCFSDWPPAIIEKLALLLEVDTFLPGNIVAETWEQSDGLIIIDVGVMAVYSPQNEELGHLIDGDSFGELSLVTDKEIRTSSVVAVTPCKILLLPKSSFRKLMRRYKSLFNIMKRQLQGKYSGKSSRTANEGAGTDADAESPMPVATAEKTDKAEC